MSTPSKIKIDLNHKIEKPLFEAAKFIDKVLKENGYEAYLVGGSIRDLLLGLPIKDIDFATDARPKDVQRIFQHTVPVGIEFGTVIVLYQKIPIEVTTYRFDAEYADGRRPVRVTFGQNLEDDVTRRDFTINGLAYDLNEATIYDYVGGFSDLDKKVIRTIGAPLDRFGEDGLRPIRGCRFAAALHFNFDESTFAAIGDTLEIVNKIARERFYDEWRKTLKIDRRHLFIENLYATGILKLFMPDITSLAESENWPKLLLALEKANIGNMAMYAAFFIYYQYGLEDRGAGLNKSEAKAKIDWLTELKFSLKQKRLAISLCNSALLPLLWQNRFKEVTFKFDLKKALSVIERSERKHHLRFLFNLLLLTFPDQHYEIKRNILALLREMHRNQEPLYLDQLAVNGNDLAAQGLKGRAVGEGLQELMALVLLDPAKNTKETLLKEL